MILPRFIRFIGKNSGIRNSAIALGALSVMGVCAVIAATRPCPPGRVDVGNGVCCFPKQTFDPGVARCVGKPACPHGFVAAGEECIPFAGWPQALIGRFVPDETALSRPDFLAFAKGSLTGHKGMPSDATAEVRADGTCTIGARESCNWQLVGLSNNIALVDVVAPGSAITLHARVAPYASGSTAGLFVCLHVDGQPEMCGAAKRQVGARPPVERAANSREVRAQRAAEANEMLDLIKKGAATYYTTPRVRSGTLVKLPCQFPGSVGLTPQGVSCCKAPLDANGDSRCDANQAAWANPTWHALKFVISDAHYFRYSFESAGVASRAIFTATAHADLDCDGIFSTFQLTAQGTEDDSCDMGTPAIFRDNETE